MGVMMQTFFWDCPRIDNKEGQWWNYIREQVPSLRRWDSHRFGFHRFTRELI